METKMIIPRQQDSRSPGIAVSAQNAFVMSRQEQLSFFTIYTSKITFLQKKFKSLNTEKEQ